MVEFKLLNVFGGTLRASDRGAGHPVVLLHKLGGDLTEFSAVAGALAGQRRVICIDLPGHGGSVMAGDPPLVMPHALSAGLVVQALDMLSVGRTFSLVGSSVGGSIALAIAALFPERTTQIVSLGASWSAGCTYASLEQAARTETDYDTEGKPLARDVDVLQRNFGLADRLQADRLNRGRMAAGRWVAPLARAVAYDNLLAMFADVVAPVVLAHGTRGHYGTYARTAQAALASARSVVIENASAFPHEDAPEQVVKLVETSLLVD